MNAKTSKTVSQRTAGRGSPQRAPRRPQARVDAPAGLAQDTPFSSGLRAQGWRAAIESTVTGMGYDLVDVERAPRGLLRVFIDRRPGQDYPTGPGEFVTVEDCEQVTRQMQYALEVEGLEYARLEVSSPGLDRPLRTEADFARFVGCEVSLTLKLPFQGRKGYKGVLQGQAPDWSVVFTEGKQEQVLGFALDELREARLVPVVDFKGRRETNKAAAAAPEAQQPDGGQDR